MDLIRTHAAPLRRTCRRLLRDDVDADDAIQETFLNALRGLSSFRGDARLSTWLHRIAINVCLARLRRARPQAWTMDADHEDDALASLLPRYHHDGHRIGPLPTWSTPLDELAQRRELCERVRRMVESLPEPHRTVIVLRDFEELSTEETAELLGVRVNAVKTRLHRARQVLRTMLEHELHREELG